jgi:hypothetical protein
VSLYYRPENVKEWTKFGDDPDRESPFTFSKADGKYGIYITCATEMGLKSDFVQKAPDPDTEPQLTLIIDATPPLVELTSFNCGRRRPGRLARRHHVEGRRAESRPARRLDLPLVRRREGRGRPVAANLDVTKGSYAGSVPNMSGTRHKLRIVAVDRFGNRGTVESDKLFAIDNDQPMVTILERPAMVSRSLRFAAKYRASDPTSGVEKVTLYAKLLSDKEGYKLLTESKAAEGRSKRSSGRRSLGDDPGRHGRRGPCVGRSAAQSPARHRRDRGYDQARPRDQELRAAVGREDLAERRLGSRMDRVGQAHQPRQAGGPHRVLGRCRGKRGSSPSRATTTPAGPTCGPTCSMGRSTACGWSRSTKRGTKPRRPRATSIRARSRRRDWPSRESRTAAQLVVSSAAVLMWSTPDKAIREVLRRALQGRRPDVGVLSTISGPSSKVLLPDQEGRYQIRASAKDSANRPISSNVITFDLISGVEQVRIIANASAEPGGLPGGRHRAQEHREDREGAAARDLRERAGVAPVAEIKGTSFTFKAPVKTGEYVVRVVVKAADGREYDSNHFRFRVQEIGTGIRLVNFRGGQSYIGGTGHFIFVETETDLSQVKVEFSSAGGKEGTWAPLTNLTLGVKGLHWVVPNLSSKTCRLRVSTVDPKGRELTDMSERDFAIEPGSGQAMVSVPPGTKPAVDEKEPLRLRTQIPDKLKGGTKLRLEWWSLDPRVEGDRDARRRRQSGRPLEGPVRARRRGVHGPEGRPRGLPDRAHARRPEVDVAPFEIVSHAPTHRRRGHRDPRK